MVPSTHTFRIVDIDVKVIYKDVKRICLCIRPPDGRLEVTVPLHRSLEEVKGFVFAKRSWIAKHQEHFKKHARQEALSFISGEKLLFLGKKLSLKVVVSERAPQATVDEAYLNLHIDPLMPISSREALVDHFYRRELQKRIPNLVEKWTTIMEVLPREVRIRKMKTKWGSCKSTEQRICLNLELIKTPTSCLEYVFVHEMVHLLVPNHGPRFYALMDRYLPTWRTCDKQLKQYPLGHF